MAPTTSGPVAGGVERQPLGGDGNGMAIDPTQAGGAGVDAGNGAGGGDLGSSGGGQQQQARPILDQERFNEAVGRVQNHVRTTYGYTMPFEQAAGLLRRDPNAKSTIDISVETLASKDQRFRQRMEEVGLRGVWIDEEGNEQGNTLQRDIHEENQRQFNLQHEQRAEQFAMDLGLRRDIFMQGVTEYNEGRMDRLAQLAFENDITVQQFEESIRQFNAGLELEERRLAEETRQFDVTMQQRRVEWAAEHELSVSQLDELKRQFDAGQEQELQIHIDRLGLDREELEQTFTIWEQEHSAQLDQFAQTLGMTRAELDQRIAEHEDAVEMFYAELTHDVDMAQIALDNELDILEVQNSYAVEAEERLFLRDQHFADLDIEEAERNRIWQSVENDLDRAHRERLQDASLTAQERADRQAREHDNWGYFFDGLAMLTGEGATRILDRIWPKDGSEPTLTPAQVAADLIAGRGEEASWWKALNPEFDDVQAEAMANNQREIRAGKPAGPVTVEPVDPVDPVDPDPLGGEVDPVGGGVDPVDPDPLGGGDDVFADGDGGDPDLVPGDVDIDAVAADPDGWGDRVLSGEEVSVEGSPHTWRKVDGVDGALVTQADNGNVVLMRDGQSAEFLNRTGRMVDGKEVLELDGTGERFFLTADGQVQKFQTGWDKITEGFTPQNVLQFVGSFYQGWQAQGAQNAALMGQIPGWAADVSTFAPLAQAALTGNPLAAFAYVGGYVARGFYDFAIGGGQRREIAEYTGFAMNQYGDLQAPEVNEGGRRLSTDNRSKANAVFDFDVFADSPQDAQPVVKWTVNNQIIVTEPLADFIERTGYVPISFHGGGDEFVANMPNDLADRVDFEPSYAIINPDGSVLLMSTGDLTQGRSGRKRVLFEPEEAQRMFSGMGNAAAGTGNPDDTDARGVAGADKMLNDAITASPMEESVTRSIYNQIEDPNRAHRFATRLATGTPFSEADVNYIFGAQSGGGFTYNSAWSIFHAMVEDGQITMRRPLGGE